MGHPTCGTAQQSHEILCMRPIGGQCRCPRGFDIRWLLPWKPQSVDVSSCTAVAAGVQKVGPDEAGGRDGLPTGGRRRRRERQQQHWLGMRPLDRVRCRCLRTAGLSAGLPRSASCARGHLMHLGLARLGSAFLSFLARAWHAATGPGQRKATDTAAQAVTGVDLQTAHPRTSAAPSNLRADVTSNQLPGSDNGQTRCALVGVRVGSARGPPWLPHLPCLQQARARSMRWLLPLPMQAWRGCRRP